jgi:hypothetical protein
MKTPGKTLGKSTLNYLKEQVDLYEDEWHIFNRWLSKNKTNNTHSFLIEPNLSYGCYIFTCQKCKLKLVTSRDSVYPFYKKDVDYWLKYSCNEYIIKGIIE